jgi:hypothetical protein
VKIGLHNSSVFGSLKLYGCQAPTFHWSGQITCTHASHGTPGVLHSRLATVFAESRGSIIH